MVYTVPMTLTEDDIADFGRGFGEEIREELEEFILQEAYELALVMHEAMGRVLDGLRADLVNTKVDEPS